MPAITDQPLRILHAVRAPVGEIIRHILDSPTDKPIAATTSALSPTASRRRTRRRGADGNAPRLKLGVHRLAIRREPGPADILVWARFIV